jgi:hypothetical protein
MRQITLKPKPVALFLLSVVGVLVLIHSIILILFFQIDDPAVFYFLRWFDLDIEYNIPSFYSAFSLFVCAALFLVIATREPKSWNYQTVCWFGLAALFLFLSIDEAFTIHERIGDRFEGHFHATGLFYFPWILPYSVGLLALIVLYSKFLWNLPKRTAIQFILCGIVFLAGAAFFDMLGGREAELNGYDSATYCLLYTVEESLEMVAIAGLIYSLLSYIESHFGHLRFSFEIAKNSE